MFNERIFAMRIFCTTLGSLFLILTTFADSRAADTTSAAMVRLSVPPVVKAGTPYKIWDIQLLSGDGVEQSVTGKIYFRRTGDRNYTAQALVADREGKFACEIPAEVTAKPFEFYIEITAAGKMPVAFPPQGASAPSIVSPDAQPPSAVGKLAVAKLESSLVSLEWTSATDDKGIRGYRIHRGESDRFAPDDNNRLGWVEADKRSFNDERPRMGKSLWYAVVAEDVAGRTGDAAYVKADVPDLKAPDNNLFVSAHSASHGVRLVWSGEVPADVRSFIILRGEGDGELMEIKTLQGANHREFVDSGLTPGKTYRYAVKMTNASFLTSAPSSIVTARPSRFAKRINCGGTEFTGPDGGKWEADSGVATGGTGASVRNDVANTDGLQVLYASERWSYGDITYKFDCPPGRYRVILHFAETNAGFTGFGKRTFDVVINGEKVAEKLDVFSKAGAYNAWKFHRVVTVPREKPEMRIQFVANPTGPAIKGIEVFAED
jgi:hypothetical protein